MTEISKGNQEKDPSLVRDVILRPETAAIVLALLSEHFLHTGPIIEAMLASLVAMTPALMTAAAGRMEESRREKVAIAENVNRKQVAVGEALNSGDFGLLATYIDKVTGELLPGYDSLPQYDELKRGYIENNKKRKITEADFIAEFAHFHAQFIEQVNNLVELVPLNDPEAEKKVKGAVIRSIVAGLAAAWGPLAFDTVTHLQLPNIDVGSAASTVWDTLWDKVSPWVGRAALAYGAGRGAVALGRRMLEGLGGKVDEVKKKARDLADGALMDLDKMFDFMSRLKDIRVDLPTLEVKVVKAEFLKVRMAEAKAQNSDETT